MDGSRVTKDRAEALSEAATQRPADKRTSMDFDLRP